MVGCCIHGDEQSVPVKAHEFLHRSYYCQSLDEDSALDKVLLNKTSFCRDDHIDLESVSIPAQPVIEWFSGEIE
jgi:hypothetical protein